MFVKKKKKEKKGGRGGVARIKCLLVCQHMTGCVGVKEELHL